MIENEIFVEKGNIVSKTFIFFYMEGNMRDDLEIRVLDEASHILSTHDTIRKTAKIYGYSKSTVHNDVSYKLKRIDPNLYYKTKIVLDENFAEKHIRGGMATKEKYYKDDEERQ